MQKPSITVLVISITNPILIGIYQDNKLLNTISKEGKTSDILPLVFQDLHEEYHIEKVAYVNGPGSFMAIKISYIFLKTFCIVNDINLFAADGFKFNNNSPIRALGKKYFFNTQDGKMSLNFLNDDTNIDPFKLPQILDDSILTDKSEPNYNLPAVN